MHPGGLRLGTSEITRLGMKNEEMRKIALLMARVIVKKEDPSVVRVDVEQFRREYQKIHYAFDSEISAYQYIRIR